MRSSRVVDEFYPGVNEIHKVWLHESSIVVRVSDCN
jgi:hypothetical protein